MKKDTKHNIEKRIFKVLNGNIGTDEKIQFENWLNANPENKVLFQKYKSTWELTGNYLKNNKDWTEIAAKINSSYSIPSYITTVKKQQQIFYLRNWQKIAAAILLIFALGSVVGIRISDRQNFQLTAVEQVKSNLLPDGSRVILNQGSVIEYPKNFNRKKRELTLQGEAFFNISADKNKPFLIHCLNTTTRVVGTKFNIFSDPIQNEVKVSVTEGIVEFFTGKYDNNKIVLKKGEEGLFNYSTGVMNKSKIKDLNFDAWNTRELIFDNTPVDQVILTLQKYFNTIIVFEGKPTGLNITTRYKDPSLQKVMNELHALVGINSEFKNDTLFIK